MNTEMIDICREEKAGVKPLVRRRFEALMNSDMPKKDFDGVAVAEQQERTLRCKVYRNRLLLPFFLHIYRSLLTVSSARRRAGSY